MAKNEQKTESKNGAPAQTEEQGPYVFKMPERAIQVQKAKRLYWFPFIGGDGLPAISEAQVEKGRPNPCHCIILDKQARHDSTDEKPGSFYTVRLVQPCMVQDRDKNITLAPAGETILVDSRAQLAKLDGFLTAKSLIECVIMPAQKIKGGQGSVLLFDIHAIDTGKKRPALPGGGRVRALGEGDDEAIDTRGEPVSDEIPF